MASEEHRIFNGMHNDINVAVKDPPQSDGGVIA